MKTIIKFQPRIREEVLLINFYG